MADEVDRALDAIAERPATWPLWPGIGERVGVRRFLLARFPFAVGCLVEGEDVVVLAVAHLRRRPGYFSSSVESRAPSRGCVFTFSEFRFPAPPPRTRSPRGDPEASPLIRSVHEVRQVLHVAADAMLPPVRGAHPA